MISRENPTAFTYPRGKAQKRRELFDAWLMMSERVKGMNAIVQNDVRVSLEETEAYEKQAGLLLLDIASLTRRTLRLLHSED